MSEEGLSCAGEAGAVFLAPGMAGLELRAQRSDVLEEARRAWVGKVGRSPGREEAEKAGDVQGVKGLPSHDGKDVPHPEGDGEPLEALILTNSEVRWAI